MSNKSDEKSSKIKFLFEKWLGNMNTTMVLLCIAILAQSMLVTGALCVSVSTIERAFNYNSFQVAFIDTIYNIALALCAFFLGYTASEHKLRWIGGGGLFLSLGCFLFILPIFIKNDFPRITENSSILCSTSEKSSGNSSACKSGNIGYLVIMCIAYGINGLGAAPLHTLAITFVEENTSREISSLFYGFYYTFAALGPVLTFLLFFVFSKIPLNLSQPKNTLLNKESEEFISAYWLIYAIGVVLEFIPGLLLLISPTIVKSSNTNSSPESPGPALSKFFKTVKRLLFNTSYLFICIGMFFDGIITNSMGVFMTKFVETQFHVHPGKAGLLAGTILVLGAATGVFVGGYLLKRFNWSSSQLIKRISIVSTIGVISLIFLFIHCPANELKGVEISPRGTVTEFTDSSCATNCHCSLEDYYPVCVDEKENFFSSCSLGCSRKNSSAGDFWLQDCLCYNNKYSSSTVKQNKCFYECNSVYIFLIFGFIASVIELLIYIPLITLTMKILGQELKLFGISIQQMIIRGSFVLGPLIYGPLIDLSCRVFKPTSNCQSSSNCIDYDSNYMSLFVGFTSIAFKLLSTIFLWIAYFLIKTTRHENTSDIESELLLDLDF